MTDLDWLPPTTAANPAAPGPKRHVHVYSPVEDACRRCGKPWDAVAARRRFASDFDRFWSKVRWDPMAQEDTRCWEWAGARTSTGYGRFQWRGGTLAHRASWALTHGPIPDGLVVMHICDNPPCVRPSHLRIGTMADNQADMAAKGRAASGDRHSSRLHPGLLRGRKGPRNFGEANGQARLTADDVSAIRSSSERLSVLSARYGVAESTISRIRHRVRWPHV